MTYLLDMIDDFIFNFMGKIHQYINPQDFHLDNYHFPNIMYHTENVYIDHINWQVNTNELMINLQ